MLLYYGLHLQALKKLVPVTFTPVGGKDEYQAELTVDCAKSCIDANGNEVPVKMTNDMIEIGIFGNSTLDSSGR
jgi:hypothetical protein